MMWKSAFIITVALCLIGLTPAGAAPLNLDLVLTSIENSYPLIQVSKVELKKTEGEYLSSKGGFDPTLKMTTTRTFGGYFQNNFSEMMLEQPTPFWGAKVYTGWRTGQGNFQPLDARLPTFNGGQFRGGIEVPILKDGSSDERRTKLKSSEQGVQAAQQEVRSQVVEVKRQATLKYWDWVATGRKTKISKDLLRLVTERGKATGIRIKRGDLPSIEQKEVDRQIIQRQAIVISSERSFQQASLDLSLYYRDSSGTPIVGDLSQLPNLQGNESCEAILNKLDSQTYNSQSHPELQKLEFQANQLQADYTLAKNQILPKLDFQLQISEQFGDNLGSGFLPPSGYPTEYRAALYFELPLFFRASLGKAASAQSLLSRNETIQGFAKNMLETQTKDSIQAMKAAYERIRLAQNEIELAQSLEKSERLRAEEGDSNLFLVNLRELSTQDAFFKEVDAFADFFRAKANFEAATAN